MLSINKTRLVALIALISTLAGALVFRTPAILFLAATILCAPLLAVAISRWMSRGLRVSRQMPAVGSVGDVVRARVTVKNAGWIPALLVHAQGRAATPEHGEKAHGERAHGGKAHGGKARGEKARGEKAHGGKAHGEKAHGEKADDGPSPFEVEGDEELVVPILMPGAQFEGEVAWRLTRRGRFDWPGARAGARDPVGLSVTLPARSASTELLVLPRPLGLKRLDASAGAPGLKPLLRNAATTASVEIHGVRPHQPGEGGRRIHWRATARTGELHVIEWEEESASDRTILLDVSAAAIAGPPGKDSLEAAIVAAASVAAFLLENGQRARLFWWADGAGKDEAPTLKRVEARHRAGLSEILTALAALVPCHDERATLPALASRVAREAREETAILLGSDASVWAGAFAPWQGQARGLAFECASFESDDNPARFTLRAGGAGAVTATMRRAPTSKRLVAAKLPPQVRLVNRTQSLPPILEQGF